MSNELKNKKRVSLLIIIIVFLVAISALGYKLFISNNGPNTSNNENNNSTDKTNIELSLEDVKKIFNGKLDENAKKISYKLTDKEYKTNFKNLDKSNNNYNIKLNCNFYDEKGGFCGSYIVKINSVIEYPESKMACSHVGNLYNYSHYLISLYEERCTGSLEIKIYDEHNTIVYSNNNAYSSIIDLDKNVYLGNNVDVKPIIIDSKLYFVEKTTDKNKMNLVSINLTNNSLKSKLINSFKASYESINTENE